MSAPQALTLKNWNVRYGEAQVLFDINVSIPQGACVAIIGRNGAGKTTLLKSLLGIEAVGQGSAQWCDVDLQKIPVEKKAQQGIAYCPDDRGLFHSLSCEENLKLVAKGEQIKRCYQAFPRLEERAGLPAAKLSGGEQQMLALARLLVLRANLCLIDEATEGLAPSIVKEIQKLILGFKAEGKTILLAESNLSFLKEVADYYALLIEGKLTQFFAARDYSANKLLIDKCLGL